MDTETFEKIYNSILKILEDNKSTNLESLGVLKYVEDHILSEGK